MGENMLGHDVQRIINRIPRLLKRNPLEFNLNVIK